MAEISSVEKIEDPPAVSKSEEQIEEDLEDGEIDDDEDDVDDDDVVFVKTIPKNCNDGDNPTINLSNDKLLKDHHDLQNDMITIDLEESPKKKSKKLSPIEDDHASSIENAIASALKKGGIEPHLPKVLENRNGLLGSQKDSDAASAGSGKSRSRNRRRKRKRERDDKDKDRDREKRCRESVEDKMTILDNIDIEMDEMEMMNVRGGSPPIMPLLPLPPPMSLSYKDKYDTNNDSSSSYDSYNSGVETEGENRRRNRKKESRRKRGGRHCDDNSSSNRHEKRSRRESAEDKHRNDPRKLELCKFYLMECCAKKDKCSYMHSDFPCKFYYLGMECVMPEDQPCKFSHGEPLSEQLRNIILKHLDSAPKEILGDFKRISRDSAAAMIYKRHEELCKKFKVENNWAPITTSPPNSRRNNHNANNNNNNNNNNINNSSNNNNINNNNNNNNNDNSMQQLQQNNQSVGRQNPSHPNIPSLLDIVINPPISLLSAKCDKRKSRWNNDSNGNDNPKRRLMASNELPNNRELPKHLDLKNLSGIVSNDHIEKLLEFGITNLEQVNQLTIDQLNQIGLTISEISEIQLKAIDLKDSHDQSTVSQKKSSRKPIKDSSSKTKTSKNTDSTKENEGAEKKVINNCVNSNSSSNSSSVVMVDYSQYLRDSNLSFDKGDFLDDEKDDEQLIIDDGNIDMSEENAAGCITETETKLDERKSDNSMMNPFGNYGMSSNMEDNETNERTDPRALLKKLKPLHSLRNKSINFNEQNSDDEKMFSKIGKHSRSCSRSQSRSPTPTYSGGSTPETIKTQNSFGQRKPMNYDRTSMYDFNDEQVEEDKEWLNKKSQKSDKDMRFMDGGNGGLLSELDLRLPFQPVTNYTPAKEIDGLIRSHQPFNYKVFEVEVPNACYTELRHNFKSNDTQDPRLRRILGWPELSQSKTSAALTRSVRKLSNSITSPDSSDGSSPKYYTPPSVSSLSDDRVKPTTTAGQSRNDPRSDPRGDPRRKPTQFSSHSNSNTPAIVSTTNTTATASSNSGGGGIKQNVEIRNLLQKSNWYKDLNSKYKIMVNQQLALVSTELKKFHQDPAQNKIFDITFILSNSIIQQIFSQLGIYIDDNGEIAYIHNEQINPNSNINCKEILNLPNLSQPPPQQMDFLRGPPPNMGPPLISAITIQAPFVNNRPSLLGLPPGASGNPFNPFANNIGDLGINPNFLNGPNLMGPGPNQMQFGSFGPSNMQQQQQQQRNFNNGNNNNNNNNNNNQRNQRNQTNRNRNNFGGNNKNKL